MEAALPYILGGAGGCGVLAVYYGFKRVADKSREDADRKKGLWLINLGIVIIGASLFASLYLT